MEKQCNMQCVKVAINVLIIYIYVNYVQLIEIIDI